MARHLPPSSRRPLSLYLSISPTTNNLSLIMDLITSPSNDFDRMVKIEFEAAEALAGLARGSDSVAQQDNNSCSENNSFEVANNFMVKNSEKSGISTAKSVKNEHKTELKLNPAYPTNCASSGRRSRQNLTEAEAEARKIRRVLANRESARQTIRRRQAVFEELSRKAVDLSWENENLKREKDTAAKLFDSLKAKNECLKTQMKIMNNETKETQEESITTNEPSISASSTNSPFFNYIQPSFVPLVWPNSVQLQCGQPAGIVLPVKPDSLSCEGSSGPGTPLYLLPYPWLFTLPQSSSNENRANSFNLNDVPKESSECQQFSPVKSEAPTPTNNRFPPDGSGGGATRNLVSCEELLTEHNDTNTVGGNKQVDKIHQVPVVCSGERSLGDTAAAAEARRKRKQLTRLKNHIHFRQLRMH